MGLTTTSWAGTFLFYIKELLRQADIDAQEQSGLNFIIDFNNPKGVFIVDMGPLTIIK